MFCNRTKEFLSQHGIVFEERDVSSDEAALGELQRRGLMTTPVTLIDDIAVVGFDQSKLSNLLGIT
jgi:glutaredoxin